MKTATRIISIAVLLSGAFFVSSAMACTTDAWFDATTGTLAEDPLIPFQVPRFKGECGLEVTGTGHVVDNSPTGETTFIGRFYFLPKELSAGTYEIFVAYGDETGTADVFVVTYDGTDIVITASDGGAFASAAAIPAKWNSVEFKWVSGDTGSLWVNSDAAVDPADDTFASGTGTVEQVRMGAVDGVGTDIAYFDDYESHRSQAVGTLLAGDSNDDGSTNILDVSGVLKEADAFTPVLAAGTPDCNHDGLVNVLDISGILKAGDAFTPVPCSQ